MNKKRIFGLILIMMLLVPGCSDNKSKELTKEFATYTNGCKAVDLLDTGTYLDKGKKLSSLLQDAIDDKDGKTCYVILEEGLFSSGYKQTLEYGGMAYYGELKDGKPDGYGVLILEGVLPIYIGEFKDGNFDGYGITISHNYESAYIVYEGEFKKGERAAGKGVVPYDFEYLDSILEIDPTLLEQEEGFYVFKTIPEYIGGISEDDYDGEGTFYYIDGTVQYTGEVKNGMYHGEGKEYYPDGTLKYDGEFSRGTYDGKGTLYDEDGNEVYKGKFKNGDCA